MCRSRCAGQRLGGLLADQLLQRSVQRRPVLGSFDPDQQRIVRLAAGVRAAPRRTASARARCARTRVGQPGRGVRPGEQGDQLAAAAEHPVEQCRSRSRPGRRRSGAPRPRPGRARRRDGTGRPRSAPPGWHRQTSAYRQAPAASAIAITSSSKRRPWSRTASAASACTGERVGTTPTLIAVPVRLARRPRSPPPAVFGSLGSTTTRAAPVAADRVQQLAGGRVARAPTTAPPRRRTARRARRRRPPPPRPGRPDDRAGAAAPAGRRSG